MNIVVNGENKKITSLNLQQAMSELGYKKVKCATALNLSLIHI